VNEALQAEVTSWGPKRKAEEEMPLADKCACVIMIRAPGPWYQGR
jgi:hypothetical protein